MTHQTETAEIVNIATSVSSDVDYSALQLQNIENKMLLLYFRREDVGSVHKVLK